MAPSYSLSLITERLAHHRASSTSGSAEGGSQAAVALVLRAPSLEGGDAEVLLIRRAEHPDDPWSGHMAFPGGRRDPADESLEMTAMREAFEEVGLALAAHARLLARLDDVPAIARGKRLGLSITPFVFELADVDAPLLPNDEVAEALWVPVGPLARGEGAGTVSYDYEGQKVELPCLRVGDRIVWGLTYHMLQSFFSALRGQ